MPLPSTLILSTAFVMALGLTLARGGITESRSRLQATLRITLLAVFIQVAHFGEELATGLYRRYSELLGLSPVSRDVFLWFNLFAFGVWGMSIWGLVGRHRAALVPIWFLGIVSVVNGLLHPGLSIASGGYFPGVVTSPFAGLAGILLIRRLLKVTERPGSPAMAA